MHFIWFLASRRVHVATSDAVVHYARNSSFMEITLCFWSGSCEMHHSPDFFVLHAPYESNKAKALRTQ